MFDFLKNKLKVQAPVAGKVVELSKVPDPAFAEGMVGPGFAVIPKFDAEGEAANVLFKAPIDGIVELVFETGHAYVISNDKSQKIMVHIGIDTVAMKGDGFEILAKQGDKVKQGDAIVKVDLHKVKQAGHDTITPVIMPESDSENIKVELNDEGAVFKC